MFASVGADGSVRMFDLRHLEHSTIIYEDPQHRPLLRLAWNRQDPSYLATISMDACEVFFIYRSLNFRLKQNSLLVGCYIGCESTMYSCCSFEQSPSVCQRYRVGSTFIVSYMHGW